MSKIEFNAYDLAIRETKEGDEYVAIKNAFESDFVEAMKEMGVTKYIKRETETNSE